MEGKKRYVAIVLFLLIGLTVEVIDEKNEAIALNVPKFSFSTFIIVPQGNLSSAAANILTVPY